MASTTSRRRHPNNNNNIFGGTNHHYHHRQSQQSNNNNQTINPAFAFLESVDWQGVSKWFAEAANLHYDLETASLVVASAPNSQQQQPQQQLSSSATWQRKIFNAVQEETLLHYGSSLIRSFCLSPMILNHLQQQQQQPNYNNTTTNNQTFGSGGGVGIGMTNYFNTTTDNNNDRTFGTTLNTNNSNSTTNINSQQYYSSAPRTLYLCVDLNAANEWIPPPPESFSPNRNNHNNNNNSSMTSRHQQQQQPRSILKPSSTTQQDGSSTVTRTARAMTSPGTGSHHHQTISSSSAIFNNNIDGTTTTRGRTLSAGRSGVFASEGSFSGGGGGFLFEDSKVVFMTDSLTTAAGVMTANHGYILRFQRTAESERDHVLLDSMNIANYVAVTVVRHPRQLFDHLFSTFFNCYLPLALSWTASPTIMLKNNSSRNEQTNDGSSGGGENNKNSNNTTTAFGNNNNNKTTTSPVSFFNGQLVKTEVLQASAEYGEVLQTCEYALAASESRLTPPPKWCYKIGRFLPGPYELGSYASPEEVTSLELVISRWTVELESVIADGSSIPSAAPPSGFNVRSPMLQAIDWQRQQLRLVALLHKMDHEEGFKGVRHVAKHAMAVIGGAGGSSGNDNINNSNAVVRGTGADAATKAMMMSLRQQNRRLLSNNENNNNNEDDDNDDEQNENAGPTPSVVRALRKLEDTMSRAQAAAHHAGDASSRLRTVANLAAPIYKDGATIQDAQSCIASVVNSLCVFPLSAPTVTRDHISTLFASLSRRLVEICRNELGMDAAGGLVFTRTPTRVALEHIEAALTLRDTYLKSFRDSLFRIRLSRATTAANVGGASAAAQLLHRGPSAPPPSSGSAHRTQSARVRPSSATSFLDQSPNNNNNSNDNNNNNNTNEKRRTQSFRTRSTTMNTASGGHSMSARGGTSGGVGGSPFLQTQQHQHAILDLTEEPIMAEFTTVMDLLEQGATMLKRVQCVHALSIACSNYSMQERFEVVSASQLARADPFEKEARVYTVAFAELESAIRVVSVGTEQVARAIGAKLTTTGSNNNSTVSASSSIQQNQHNSDQQHSQQQQPIPIGSEIHPTVIIDAVTQLRRVRMCALEADLTSVVQTVDNVFLSNVVVALSNNILGTRLVYEASKSDPPQERCMPRTVSAILWVRRLYRRIESVIEKVCTSHWEEPLRAAVAKQMVRDYNACASALVTYEQQWLAGWLSSVETSMTGLRAALFVKNEPPTNEEDEEPVSFMTMKQKEHKNNNSNNQSSGANNNNSRKQPVPPSSAKGHHHNNNNQKDRGNNNNSRTSKYGHHHNNRHQQQQQEEYIEALSSEDISHLVVNFDPGVLQLFSEARVLVLIGVKLPEAAYSTLVRTRAEILRNRDYAQEVLQLFKEAEVSIEPCLVPLFALHRERAAASIQVGLSSMTWSSMNISPYLQDTIRLLTKWVELVKRVTKDFHHRVIRSLETIAETRWVICGHDAPSQQYGKDGRPVHGHHHHHHQLLVKSSSSSNSGVTSAGNKNTNSSSINNSGNSNNNSNAFLFPSIVSLLNAQHEFASAAAKRVNVRSTEIASALRQIIRVVIEDLDGDGMGNISDLRKWVTPFSDRLFVDLERYVLNATVSAMQNSVESLCTAWQIKKTENNRAEGENNSNSNNNNIAEHSSAGGAPSNLQSGIPQQMPSASAAELCPMFLSIQVKFLPPKSSRHHAADSARNNRITKYSIVSLEPSPAEIQRSLLRVARIMLESAQLIYSWAPEGGQSSNLLVDVAHVQQALHYLQRVADLAQTSSSSSPSGNNVNNNSTASANMSASMNNNINSNSSIVNNSSSASINNNNASTTTNVNNNNNNTGVGNATSIFDAEDPDEDELLEEAQLKDETADLGLMSPVDTWDLLQYTRRANAERSERKQRFLKDRYPIVGKDRAITTAFLQLVGMFAPFGREIDAVLAPVAGPALRHNNNNNQHSSSSSSSKVVEGPWSASFTDREASVSAFASSKPKPPSYNDYDSRMRTIVDYSKEVSMMPDIHRIGCIAIDLRPLKTSLNQECNAWLETYGRSLCAATRRELETIIHRLEDFRQRMSRPLLELSDVMVVANSVSAFRSEEESIDARTAPVQAGYDVLQTYKIKVPLEDLNVADALYLTLANVKEIARTAHDQLRLAAPSFRSALVTYIQSFEDSIGAFVKDYRGSGPQTVGTEPRMATQRMKHFSKQYYDRARRLEQVRMGESVFGLTPNSYDEFTSVGKELELQARLYDLYSEVLAAVQACEPLSWMTVNIESLESQMISFRDRLMGLPRALREFEAFVELKNLLQNVLTVLPFVPRLRHPSVRTRHWDTISRLRPPQTMVFESSGVTDLRLSHFFDAGFSVCAAEIDDLLYGAQKEAELEEKLRRVSNDFVKRQIILASHRGREGLMLKPDSTAALLVDVEDAQAVLVTLMSSRFNTSVRKEIGDWMTRLSNVSRRLEDWLDIQRTWSHLESVFLGSGDIAKEMPLDVKRFLAVDRQWERMMRIAADQPLVVPLCAAGETVANSLPTLRAALESSQRSLSSYVHTKRVAYPRFFFISDSELLDILGRSSDTTSVVPHLRSLFNNIQTLEFAPQKHNNNNNSQQKEQQFGSLNAGTGAPLRSPPAIAFVSTEKERIQFVKPVPTAGNDVVKFLQLLLDATHYAMKLQVRYIREEVGVFVEQLASGYIESGTVDRVLYRTPAQVLLVLLQMTWTTLCESVLLEGKSASAHSAMRGARALLDYLVRIVRNATDLSACDRVKVDSAITIHLHNVDNMINLSKIIRGGRGITDFEWLRMMRTNWQTDKEELVVSLAEVELTYEYEYVGSVERLVVTDLTDRIYLSCTQAIQMHLGAAPAGPAGTGKTETTRDLARACGRYFLVTNCNSSMSAESVGRIVHGTAQSGCWFAFDEVNRIEVGVLSAVAAQIASVFTAKRESRRRFIFTNGNPIILDRGCAIFVTMNPTYVGRTALPENLKALFRSVAVVVPDTAAIVRVRLASSGFTESSALARKLTLLYDFCASQLSQAGNYDFGLRSILSVLRAAGPALRSELRMLGSRNYDPVLVEHSVLVRVIRSINTSKLLDSDAVLFRKLLADTFPNVMNSPKANSDGVTNEMNQAIIEKVASSRGFVFNNRSSSSTTAPAAGPTGTNASPSTVTAQNSPLLLMTRKQQQQQLLAQQEAANKLDFLIDRCMMLFDQWSVRHGLCCVGATGTGKSSAISIVAAAMVAKSQQQQGEEQSDTNNKMMKSASDGSPSNPASVSSLSSQHHHHHHGNQVPRIQKCNPKAVEASRLFGSFDARTTDWTEGVLVELWRRAARKQDEWSAIVFDGPVDANWVEDLNSVLDDTKVLTLANGERLPLGPKMRIILETDNLKHASPATVSRLGLVYFSHNASDRWSCILQAWMRSAGQKYSRVQPAFLDGISSGLLGNMQQACDIVSKNFGATGGGSGGGSSSSSSFCIPSVFAQAVVRYVDAILADTIPGVCPSLPHPEQLDRNEGAAVAAFALYWAGASLQQSSCHEGEWGRAFQDARRILTKKDVASTSASSADQQQLSSLSKKQLRQQQQQKEKEANEVAQKNNTNNSDNDEKKETSADDGTHNSNNNNNDEVSPTNKQQQQQQQSTSKVRLRFDGTVRESAETIAKRKATQQQQILLEKQREAAMSMLDPNCLNLPPVLASVTVSTDLATSASSSSSTSQPQVHDLPLESLVFSLEKKMWMPWKTLFLLRAQLQQQQQSSNENKEDDDTMKKQANNNSTAAMMMSLHQKSVNNSNFPSPRRFVVADDSSVRAGYWIEHLRRCQVPVLISGRSGCGKSQLARHVLEARIGSSDGSIVIVKEIALSFATSAVSLQRSLLGSAERTSAANSAGNTSSTMGAGSTSGEQQQDGSDNNNSTTTASAARKAVATTCTLLLDDLHLPARTSWGDQPSSEVLRQLFEDGGFYCSPNAAASSSGGGGGGSGGGNNSGSRSSGGNSSSTTKTTQEWMTVQEIHQFCATVSSGTSADFTEGIPPRLLRQFALWRMGDLSGGASEKILLALLTEALSGSVPSSIMGSLSKISKATYNVCALASDRFRNTSLPETVQYQFSMKDMIRFVDGVVAAVKDANGKHFAEDSVMRLIAYELRRTLCDKLSRKEDLKWLSVKLVENIFGFTSASSSASSSSSLDHNSNNNHSDENNNNNRNQKIMELAKDKEIWAYLPDGDDDENNNNNSKSNNATTQQNNSSSNNTSSANNLLADEGKSAAGLDLLVISPNYYPLKNGVPQAQRAFTKLLNEFNESHPPTARLDFAMTEFFVKNIVRVSRVLRIPRGHLTLLGVGGSGKVSLVQVACLICGHRMIRLRGSSGGDVSSADILDEVREALRLATAGKTVTFVVSDNETVDNGLLELVSNLLSDGELPVVFTKEELEALREEMFAKMDAPATVSPSELFVNVIRSRIHVACCFSPSVESGLRERVRNFPSLVSSTTVIWVPAWPVSALEETATMLLNKAINSNTNNNNTEETNKGFNNNNSNNNSFKTNVSTSTLAKVCASVHSITFDQATLSRTQHRKCVYVTPKMFLDYMDVFVLVATKLKNQIQSVKSIVDTGINRMIQVQEGVTVMRRELQEKQVSLQKAQQVASDLLLDLDAKRSVAERSKRKVEAERNIIRQRTNQIEKERAEADRDMKAAEPTLRAAEEALRTIDPEDISNVKAFKEPPLMVRRVLDGVLILLKKPLDSQANVPLTDNDGRLHITPSWGSARTMLASMGILNSLLEYNRDSVNGEQIELLEPYLNQADYTKERARSAAGSLAGLCTWVRAMSEYYKLAQEMIPKRRRVKAASAQLAQSLKELGKAEKALAEEEGALEVAQNIHNEAMDNTKTLEEDAKRTTKRLATAEALLNGLGSENRRWRQQSSDQLEKLKRAEGNAIVGAAFAAYCGPFDLQTRAKLIANWRRLLVSNKLMYSPEIPPHRLVLLTSEAGDDLLEEWHAEGGLPQDELSEQNAVLCNLDADHGVASWMQKRPLLIDPDGQGAAWAEGRSKDRFGPNLRLDQLTAAQVQPIHVSLSNKNFGNLLEDAARKGRFIMVHDVESDTEKLVSQLRPVLSPSALRRAFDIEKGLWYKVAVINSKEVIVHDHFSIVLCTRSGTAVFPPEMFALVQVCEYSVTAHGLEQQLLGITVHHERGDVEDQKTEVRNQIQHLNSTLKKLEEALLGRLNASLTELLDDEQIVDVFANIREQAAITQSSLESARETEKILDITRENYRSIARRAARVCLCTKQMKSRNVMYSVSLNSYIKIFELALRTSSSSSSSSSSSISSVEKRKKSISKALAKLTLARFGIGLFNADKAAFLLDLAICFDDDANANGAALSQLLAASTVTKSDDNGSGGGATSSSSSSGQNANNSSSSKSQKYGKSQKSSSTNQQQHHQDEATGQDQQQHQQFTSLPHWIPHAARPGLRILLIYTSPSASTTSSTSPQPLIADPKSLNALRKLADMIMNATESGGERSRWSNWLEADPEPESGFPTGNGGAKEINPKMFTPLDFLVALRLLRPDRVSAGATQYCSRILGEATASLASSATDFKDLSQSCSSPSMTNNTTNNNNNNSKSTQQYDGNNNQQGVDLSRFKSSSSIAGLCAKYETSSSSSTTAKNDTTNNNNNGKEGEKQQQQDNHNSNANSSNNNSSNSTSETSIVPVLCVLAEGTDPTSAITAAAKSQRAALKIVSLGAGQEATARRAVQSLIDRDKVPENDLSINPNNNNNGSSSSLLLQKGSSTSSSSAGASSMSNNNNNNKKHFEEKAPDWVLLQNCHLSVAFCFDLVDMLRHEEASTTSSLLQQQQQAQKEKEAEEAAKASGYGRKKSGLTASSAGSGANATSALIQMQQQQQQGSNNNNNSAAVASGFSSTGAPPRRMLWITAAPHDQFPAGLLQRTLHVTDEPPQGVRAGLLRAFRSFTADQLEIVETPIYRRLLYVVSFMHSVLISRRRYGVIGWSQSYEFTPQDLQAAAWYVGSHLLSEGDADWSALRYMLGAVHLGGRVMDNMDRRTITAFCDKWLRHDVVVAGGAGSAIVESSSVVPGEEDDPNRIVSVYAPQKMKDLSYLVPPSATMTATGSNTSSSNNNTTSDSNTANNTTNSTNNNTADQQHHHHQQLPLTKNSPPPQGEGYPLLQSASSSGWAYLIRNWIPSMSNDPPAICGLFPGAEAARGSTEGLQLLVHVVSSSFSFLNENNDSTNNNTKDDLLMNVENENDDNAASDVGNNNDKLKQQQIAAKIASNPALIASRDIILAQLESAKDIMTRPEVKRAVEAATTESPLGPALQQEYHHALSALTTVLNTAHAVIASATGQAPLTAELVAASEALSNMKPLPLWLTLIPASDRLSSWTRSFKRRLQQVIGWALNTLPRNSFWLGGMRYPKCWIACVRQDLARREGVPLNEIMLVADVAGSLAAAPTASQMQQQESQQQAQYDKLVEATSGHHYNNHHDHHNNNNSNNANNTTNSALASIGSGNTSAVNAFLEMGMYRVTGMTLEGAVANSAHDFTGLATLTPPPGRQFRTALPTIWIGAARVSGLGESPEVDVVASIYSRRKGAGRSGGGGSAGGAVGLGGGNASSSVGRRSGGIIGGANQNDLDAIANAVSPKSVFWCPMYHNSRRGASRLLMEVPFRSNPEESTNNNEAWSLASVAVVCALDDE